MTNPAMRSCKGKHHFLLSITRKDSHQVCLVDFFPSCDTKYLQGCVICFHRSKGMSFSNVNVQVQIICSFIFPDKTKLHSISFFHLEHSFLSFWTGCLDLNEHLPSVMFSFLQITWVSIHTFHYQSNLKWNLSTLVVESSSSHLLSETSWIQQYLPSILEHMFHKTSKLQLFSPV